MVVAGSVSGAVGSGTVRGSIPINNTIVKLEETK